MFMNSLVIKLLAHHPGEAPTPLPTAGEHGTALIIIPRVMV